MRLTELIRESTIPIPAFPLMGKEIDISNPNAIQLFGFSEQFKPRRSHSGSYGEDEQRRHGMEGAFSCSSIYKADH